MNVLAKPLNNIVEARDIDTAPRFEGCNINTWIGFKHVCYMLEEALLETCRQSGLKPRELYEVHAACLEIVASDTKILHAFHLDDKVRVNVEPIGISADNELDFNVNAYVFRDGVELRAANSKMSVALKLLEATDAKPLSADLALIAKPALDRGAQKAIAASCSAEDVSVKGSRTLEAMEIAKRDGLIGEDENAYAWLWRIPYFYCYYNERLRHNGYLRLMEEVVDLFLEHRGISIKDMVDNKRLIPVVPNARVSMVTEALMEEPILTVYRVEEIFKGFTYRSAMDCYVFRAGKWVLVQTGQITHGYAEIMDRVDWKLIQFDADTMAALSADKG